MSEIKKKWDYLPKDKRDKAIREIIAHFETEMEQELGFIGAEDLLDFFLENIGPDIYNKAVYDAKNTIKLNFENLDIDLEQLINK
jgi:uncharacterized protein (DUF2164 family)